MAYFARVWKFCVDSRVRVVSSMMDPGPLAQSASTCGVNAYFITIDVLSLCVSRLKVRRETSSNKRKCASRSTFDMRLMCVGGEFLSFP